MAAESQVEGHNETVASVELMAYVGYVHMIRKREA